MSERVRKVNSVIRREISELMTKNINFKHNVFVTISQVDTTKDLRYTRIFVRVFPHSEINYAMKTLEYEKSVMQKQLHKQLHLKVLPKISFIHDRTGDDVDALEQLLQE